MGMKARKLEGMKAADHDRSLKAPTYSQKVVGVCELIQQLGLSIEKLTFAQTNELQGALERAWASTQWGSPTKPTYKSPDGQWWDLEALEISRRIVRDVQGHDIKSWPDPERRR